MLEPLLAHSYITSVARTVAGGSAKELPNEQPVSEFVHGHLEPTAMSLTSGEAGSAAEVVKAVVRVDVVRLLREIVPLSSIQKATFWVVQSAQCR